MDFLISLPFRIKNIKNYRNLLIQFEQDFFNNSLDDYDFDDCLTLIKTKFHLI
jgi:hypothetical protein